MNTSIRLKNLQNIQIEDVLVEIAKVHSQKIIGKAKQHPCKQI